MKTHTVLSPVKDADGIHQPGETIELEDKAAAELIELNVVAAAAPAGKKSKVANDDAGAGGA